MKLTPIEQSDMVTLQKWLSNESLFRILAVEPPDTTKPIRAFMIRLNDGTPVGWVELFNIDIQNAKCEVGIAIPSQRGRGMSQRVGRKVLSMVFNHTGLNRIYARVPENNTTSIRLLKRLDFTLEGVEREAAYRGDRFEDLHIYAITRRDYMGKVSDNHASSTTVDHGGGDGVQPRTKYWSVGSSADVVQPINGEGRAST